MKKSQLLNTYEKVTSSKYRVVLETTSYMNVASDQDFLHPIMLRIKMLLRLLGQSDSFGLFNRFY